MPCQDYLSLVEKLADGEVTPAEKRAAEAHLETCDACREHLRFLEALPTAARRVSVGEPPEAYWDTLPRKVMTRIAKLDERERHPRRWWLFGLLSPSGMRWAGALAAAVVAAVVGWRVLETPFTDQRTSGDVLRPPSATPMREDAEGKLDQAMPGGALELEEQPADEALSPRSSAESEEGEPRARERRVAPSEPTRQAGEAPSATPQGMEERDSLTRPEPFADDRNEALQKSRAAAALVGREESGKEEAQELRAPPPAAPEEPSARPNPAPVGARISQTRPDQEGAASTVRGQATAVSNRSAEEDYRTLLERYPQEAAVSAETLEGTATPSEGAPSDEVKECADWRRFIFEHGGSEQEASARYRLALCSIALYDRQPSDDHRRQAVTDGQSFLAMEPSGERSDAVRRALGRIER